MAYLSGQDFEAMILSQNGVVAHSSRTDVLFGQDRGINAKNPPFQAGLSQDAEGQI